MSKSLNVLRTGMIAYMGIASEIERDALAREIADTLNPPVAATLTWIGKNACVYQTHYYGDVCVVRKARRHLMVTVG